MKSLDYKIKSFKKSELEIKIQKLNRKVVIFAYLLIQEKNDNDMSSE